MCSLAGDIEGGLFGTSTQNRPGHGALFEPVPPASDRVRTSEDVFMRHQIHDTINGSPPEQFAQSDPRPIWFNRNDGPGGHAAWTSAMAGGGSCRMPAGGDPDAFPGPASTVLAIPAGDPAKGGTRAKASLREAVSRYEDAR